MEMFAYSGDVKLLKSFGYKFQKLFASNHKNYSRDSISMYVVCKMAIEIRNLDDEHQKKFVEFVLNNLDKEDSFWWEDRDLGKIMYYNAPKWYVTRYGNIVNKDDYMKLKIEFMDVYRDIMQKEKDPNSGLSKEEIEELYKKADKMEGARDGSMFHKETVEQIMELNSIEPLKLITLEEA